MFDASALDLHPGMLRLLEDRPRGGRIVRVCDRADRNADQRLKNVRFPEDRRAAIRTEIAVHLAAAGAGAGELFCGAGDGDGLGGIERADTERRTGAPLARDAVT